MMLTRAFALALALASPLSATAQEDGEDEKRWSGEGEFGLVATTGNTETETLNTKLSGAYERESWIYRLGIRALSASEDGNTTAERYELSGMSEYHTSERSYWFGALRYEDDRFSGFEHQGTLTAGYGRTLLDRETSHLDMEIGLGLRRARPAQAPEMAEPPAAETDPILRGAAKYWWQLTDSTRFENDFLVETGEENTFLENQAALRVAINAKFSVKLGFAVRHNTEVPEGTEQTDTVSTVNLAYAFQ